MNEPADLRKSWSMVSSFLSDCFLNVVSESRSFRLRYFLMATEDSNQRSMVDGRMCSDQLGMDARNGFCGVSLKS